MAATNSIPGLDSGSPEIRERIGGFVLRVSPEIDSYVATSQAISPVTCS